MTCGEVAARVTDCLDGALSPADGRRFEDHLEDCDDCRRYVAQFAQTLDALAALDADDRDPDGVDELLDAFRAHVGRGA
jgi:anti-sigma factor RsiW